MSQNNDSNPAEEPVDDDVETSTPDIHPALIDDDDEYGGRKPIDLSSDAFGSLNIEDLFKPKKKKKPEPEPEALAPEVVEPEVIEPSAEAKAAAEQQAQEFAKRETELLAEIDKQKNNYLRAVADLQNVRRRSADEIERNKNNANERLITEILPLVDDLDLCIQAAATFQNFEQLVSGVGAIYRKFGDTLAKIGVQPVATIGEQFNPDLHDAVMIDQASDEEDGTVIAEFRKGYTLHGRLIRPALVKVAQS